MSSHKLCWKNLNQPAIVSLRYFYVRRCSFSRAIFWYHKKYGEPPFFDRKGQNTWKNDTFFHQKIILLTFFFPKMIFVRSRKIYESIEKKMLFLLVQDSAMLILEIMNDFCNILKVSKITILLVALIMTYVIIQ